MQAKSLQIGTCGCTIQLTKFQTIMKKSLHGKKNIQKIKLVPKMLIDQLKLKGTKILKNTKHGNSILIYLIIFLFFFNVNLIAEDKIISSPLINLEQIKPSFEEVENSNVESNESNLIKDKKKTSQNNSTLSAKFIGLDKITAKTSEIIVNLGEIKKFGPLEIKVLKCGKVNSENLDDKVAYLQVKDASKNQDEKVFIFNGWTFASDPSIAPFDHAVYDLQLVSCNNI